MSDLAHLEHGGQVTYAVLFFSETPILAACIMAFSSAWQIRGYFFSLSINLSSSSSMPLGNPVNPVERISRS